MCNVPGESSLFRKVSGIVRQGAVILALGVLTACGDSAGSMPTGNAPGNAATQAQRTRTAGRWFVRVSVFFVMASIT